ncbi:hypothetical protein [Burkholderia sp. LMG 32019]|uniref:hypothetical protein n=1 Tax=Burkholderia sp. LMG 32019 TaxID=3158173 RepID=UPI003C2ACC65
MSIRYPEQGSLLDGRSPASGRFSYRRAWGECLGGDLLTLARNPSLWGFGLIVFGGYHLSWATFSISPYLQQEGVGMSIVAAGFIASLKLWMLLIGGIVGGFVGDRFGTLNVLGAALFCAALAFVALIVFPSFNQIVLLAGAVIVIGLLTYAVRGLYWSVLERCDVPPRVTARHRARDRYRVAARLFAGCVPAAVERLADDRVSGDARLSAVFRVCRAPVAEGHARTRIGVTEIVTIEKCVAVASPPADARHRYRPTSRTSAAGRAPGITASSSAWRSPVARQPPVRASSVSSR